MHKHTRAYADSGYTGLDKIHQQAEVPFKKKKGKSLDKEEKLYNHALSRLRVIVENIIGDMKVFRIFSDRYRNKRKRHHLKVNIIAGLVNIKNGFSPA